MPVSLARDTSKVARLISNYPNAYHDFYPSRAPCVFKSGPGWLVNEGSYRILREARQISSTKYPLGSTWLSIGQSIYQRLDEMGIKWTSINPLAYANQGEAKPFCSFLLYITVTPDSLLYSDAVVAADAIQQILTDAGLSTAEVAFVESVLTYSVAGPKLLPFDPLRHPVPELRKPFTPALGLSIAPLGCPQFEGTASLYYRLSKEDKRIAILTCAHVARPTPVYGNTGMTYKTKSQRREGVVALGNASYNNAIEAMTKKITTLTTSIEIWNNVLARLGEFINGEDITITENRDETLQLIANTTRKIKHIKMLQEEVTKDRTPLEQRVIGFVLHSEIIKVSAEPHGFTQDWALVQLYDDKIDWSTFQGNKVYVGDKLSGAEFGEVMFPQLVDRAGYSYPPDGLLQAYGVVGDAEIRNPQHLDVDGDKCLLVVKNGLATGTTIGRANGLESFTRTYSNCGTIQTSIEIAVLPYDRAHGSFSACGDSGSIVLARDGRIVGLITGGMGITNETDITYLTPYWWLDEQIKLKFPGCFLYEAVE
ncbi:hypothetical protein TWF730_011199 [Orbilia blumenaviensis]|uniref:Uncharacterized protein n=1 Tax=Orbilia blumenaviensis TaxID=1796055 RepID=A0AAV9UP54_9PEZI